jgi:hypothetical protein
LDRFFRDHYHPDQSEALLERLRQQALALAIAGDVVIRHSDLWYPVVSACVVGLRCFALLAGGPTMRKWILTEPHRYRSPVRLGANKQLLRPI